MVSSTWMLTSRPRGLRGKAVAGCPGAGPAGTVIVGGVAVGVEGRPVVRGLGGRAGVGVC